MATPLPTPDESPDAYEKAHFHNAQYQFFVPSIIYILSEFKPCRFATKLFLLPLPVFGLGTVAQSGVEDEGIVARVDLGEHDEEMTHGKGRATFNQLLKKLLLAFR